MADEEISQFVSITGASADKARFYVESAQGDVQEAVSAYFEAEGAEGESVEDDDDGGLEQETPVATQASVEASPAGPRTLSGAPAQQADWPSSSNKATKQATSAASRFASLSDYRSDADAAGRGGQADEGADDDDPVNFFTGGERSGLSVQNPEHFRRRAANAPDVVQDILQRAREASQRRAEGGGDDDDDEDWDDTVQPSVGRGAAAKKSTSFAGQGRSLASSDEPSQGETPGAFQLAGSSAQGEAAPADEIANRRIIFWQDGFSLEDGPLCRYDDPQHAHTLAMINQGSAPLSFLNVRYGQRVNLNVEQRQEKYKPPPPAPMKPFSGSGNRLGSPAPGVIAMSSTTTKSTQPAAPASSEPNTSIKVDDSQPVTQLQVRLADGQRVVGRFNHSHTVADVRTFIDAGHASSDRSYVLQTSFPPKPITDETQSLKDAGLVNAVVIQKLT